MAQDRHVHPEQAHGLPFGWIGRTAELAEHLGLPIRKQLLAAGVAKGATSITRDTLIHPAEFLLMAALLINAFDDEMHGITPVRMARGTASMLAKAIAGSRTLEDAVDTVVRFFDLIGSSCRLRVETSENLIGVVIHAEGQDESLTSLIEELVAQFLHHQFSYFLGFPLPLLALKTSALGHPSSGQNHPYLCCPTYLGSVTSLIFSAHYMRCSSRVKIESGPLLDAQLFWLSHHPSQAAAGPASVEGLSLSGKITSFLSVYDVDLKECCARLSLANRDVQRCLLEEGTSFRKLRRSALIRRARPSLVAGATTEDIAESLGYSDARSFRRALKTAAGLSISELRRTTLQPEVDDQTDLLRAFKSQAMMMA